MMEKLHKKGVETDEQQQQAQDGFFSRQRLSLHAAMTFVIILPFLMVIVAYGVNSSPEVASTRDLAIAADLEGSSETETSTVVAISDPQAQLDFVREAILKNQVVSQNAASVIPSDAEALKGKHEDETADPLERAASWLVHVDPMNAQDELVKRFALATIYYANGGKDWTKSENWLSEKSVCDGWHGIKCCDQFIATITCFGKDPNEIVELDLSNNNLTGEISSVFSLLTDIRIVMLSFNGLTGQVSGEVFGSMPNLRMLYLQHNKLTGPIPPNLRDQYKKLGTFGF